MARNLVKKGVNLKTFDSSSEARNLFENCTESLEDLAKNSNFVITMLPNSTIVREVYEGNGGVFAHAKKGTVMIDCSTIEHDVARDLASKAKSGGFSMIDAPVSGGICIVTSNIFYVLRHSGSGARNFDDNGWRIKN